MRRALALFLFAFLAGSTLASPDPVTPADADVKAARAAFEAAASQGDHKELRRWLPALARIGTRRAIDPVLERFPLIRQSAQTYRAARAALAGVSDKGAWKRVLRAMRQGRTPHLRVFALEVVDARAAAGDDEALVSLLTQRSGAVRRRALVALAKRPRDAVVEGLIAHMERRDKDPDAEQQQCAVALSRILGARLDRGEDYRARWTGSIKAWKAAAAKLSAERAARSKELQAKLKPSPESPWKGAVGEAGAKLFVKPLPEAEQLVALLGGTKLEVIARQGAWWQVRTSVAKNTLTGWVQASAVSVKVPQPPKDTPSTGLATYYDVPLVGKGIVFLVDFSASMVSRKLMAGAKRELSRTIRALPTGTRFTVIAFATKTYAWHDELMPASDEHKASAIKFVVGLKNGNWTSLDYALKRAFRCEGLDTVVVLTDGYPERKKTSIGATTILNLVDGLNRSVQARVSCFGFKGANHKLLRELAAATNGDYRRIGG